MLRRTIAALLLAGLALAAAVPAAEGQAKVNVNTASAAQLALLPRIGPSVASRILEYRDANGPFKSVEDLLLVRGIGERTLELLKPYIALTGETTLSEKVRSAGDAEAQDEGQR